MFKYRIDLFFWDIKQVRLMNTAWLFSDDSVSIFTAVDRLWYYMVHFPSLVILSYAADIYMYTVPFKTAKKFIRNTNYGIIHQQLLIKHHSLISLVFFKRKNVSVLQTLQYYSSIWVDVFTQTKTQNFITNLFFLSEVFVFLCSWTICSSQFVLSIRILEQFTIFNFKKKLLITKVIKFTKKHQANRKYNFLDVFLIFHACMLFFYIC